MTLRDYIANYYGGNNSEFARATGETRQQVNKWISKGYIVVNHTLCKPHKELPSPP